MPLLVVTLVALLASGAVSSVRADPVCIGECRDEMQSCLQDTKDEFRTCKEECKVESFDGDGGAIDCLRDCRVAARLARKQCRIGATDCRVACSEDRRACN
jgi:hypothetical protein